MPEPGRPQRQHSQVSLKTVFTVCAGVLLVGAALFAVSRSLVALTLTGAALLLALALDRMVAWLRRRLCVGRGAAIALTMTSLFGVVAAAGALVIPPAVAQAVAFVKHVPALVLGARRTQLFQQLDVRFDLTTRIQGLVERVPDLVSGAASPVLSAVGGVLSLVGAAISVFFLTTFMLIFGPRLVAFVLGETLPERRSLYADILQRIYSAAGGYVGGVSLVCACNGTATTIFLAILKVPFFLPLGLASGTSSAFPYVGPFVAGAIISLIALTTSGIGHGLACAAFFIAYGQIEGNVLAPIIFKRTVNLNPLVVTLSILFAAEIAGLAGAVLAVPMVAAGQIILLEVLRLRRARLGIRAGEGPPPAGAPREPEAS